MTSPSKPGRWLDSYAGKSTFLKILTNEKAWGKAKMDVTVDGKKLTEAKMVKKAK